jgi:hypothetical protein
MSRSPMNADDPLAHAIQSALASDRLPAHPRDLPTVARDALILIEHVRTTLPHFEMPDSERNQVALALLLASLDQARTLCYLLTMDARNGWYSALILHRSQIDHFLRGAFFAQPASDQELAYFLGKNKLPSRSPPGTSKRALSTNELAAIVIAGYDWDGEKLLNTIRNHWGPLSGIVHGGRELLAAYLSEDGIGAEIELTELVGIVINTVALSHMVSAVLMAITPLGVEGVQSFMVPVHDDFRAFVSRHGE